MGRRGRMGRMGRRNRLRAVRARRDPAAGAGRPGRPSSRTPPACPSPSPFQRSVYLPGGVTLGQVLALIVGPFAPAQAQFDLDISVLEIQREGDQRQTLLGGLGAQAVDLLPV